MNSLALLRRVLPSITATIVWVAGAGLMPAVKAQVLTPRTSVENPASEAKSLRPTYTLGTDDQVTIRATNLDEISDKPFRIDSEGFLTLPTLGRVKAAGLTVEELEAELRRLMTEFVKQPQVTISIVQFRREPVFIVGAFRNPGIHPLQGRKTLIETLTTIGGMQANTSRRIKITRRMEYGKIPLPNAVEDEATQTSSVEINLNSLMETVNAAEDIELKAFDVIKAGTSGAVYASGQLLRSGAYEMNDRESMPVTQVIALAGGLAPDAAAENSVVLRPILDTTRRAEIRVNLKEVLSGRANDFPMLPNDILVVPRKGGTKAMAGRVLSILGPTVATTLLVVAIGSL